MKALAAALALACRWFLPAVLIVILGQAMSPMFFQITLFLEVGALLAMVDASRRERHKHP